MEGFTALQGFTSSALLHNAKFGPFDLLPLMKGDPSKVRSHFCANYHGLWQTNQIHLFALR